MIHAHDDSGTDLELGPPAHGRPHADVVHSEAIDDPTELTVAEALRQRRRPVARWPGTKWVAGGRWGVRGGVTRGGGGVGRRGDDGRDCWAGG
jgi:hypothetical protein